MITLCTLYDRPDEDSPLEDKIMVEQVLDHLSEEDRELIRLKKAENSLGSIKRQDRDLMDNVATVNGTIYLNWASLWQIADIYAPGSLWAWILVFAAIATYIRQRNNYL